MHHDHLCQNLVKGRRTTCVLMGCLPFWLNFVGLVRSAIVTVSMESAAGYDFACACLSLQAVRCTAVMPVLSCQTDS
jgi:hypothetical protein